MLLLYSTFWRVSIFSRKDCSKLRISCQTKIIENIKFLRTSYNLSQTNFAKLLNFSLKQINHLENDRRNLTLEQALLINQIFGVSIDWILGISDTPLTKESIEFAEDRLFKIMNGTLSCFDTYFSNPNRLFDYSLQVRANILFLTYAIQIDGHFVTIDYLNEQSEEETLHSEFIDMLVEESTWLDDSSDSTYKSKLFELISRERTIPYFKIVDQQ